jgi:hypothetical protein
MPLSSPSQTARQETTQVDGLFQPGSNLMRSRITPYLVPCSLLRRKPIDICLYPPRFGWYCEAVNKTLHCLFLFPLFANTSILAEVWDVVLK